MGPDEFVTESSSSFRTQRREEAIQREERKERLRVAGRRKRDQDQRDLVVIKTL